MHTPYCDMAEEHAAKQAHATATGATSSNSSQYPSTVPYTAEWHSSSDRRRMYEEDLFRRQQEHFRQIQQNQDQNWQPCLHDQCPECVGTGVKKDGSHCVHGISCPCPKCSPRC